MKGLSQSVQMLAAISVIIVVFGVYLLTNTGFKAQFISEGFTVRSITAPSIITTDQDLKSLNWLIDTIFNSGGQSVVGTIDAQETKALTGKELKYPLRIEASAVDQTVSYDVLNRNIPITKITMIIKRGLVVVPRCDGTPTYEKYGFTKRYCFYYDNVGVKGDLQKSYTRSAATIKLSVSNPNGPQVLEQVISTDNPTVMFKTPDGQTWATAQILGSLVTGTETPDANKYTPIFVDKTALGLNKYWHLTTPDKMSAYEQQLAVVKQKVIELTGKESSIIDAIATEDTMNSIVSDLNSKLLSVAADDVSIGTFVTTPIDFTKDTGAKFQITVLQKFSNPDVLFKVRADWLGIVIDTAQPQIISVTSTPFESGKQAQITVQVKNLGTVRASFVAEFPVCSPFTQNAASQTQSVDANSIANIIIPITAGSFGDNVQATCKVIVKDFNNPSKFDTANIVVQQNRVITPIYTTTTTLPPAKDGECPKGYTPKTDQFGDITCVPPAFNIMKYAALILGFLFGLSGALLTILLFGDAFGKKNKPIVILLALIIGVLVGTLIWWVVNNVLLVLGAAAIYAAFATGGIGFIGSLILAGMRGKKK